MVLIFNAEISASVSYRMWKYSIRTALISRFSTVTKSQTKEGSVVFQHVRGPRLHKKHSNNCSKAEILGDGMCQIFLLGHLRCSSYWCCRWWAWRLFERVACSRPNVPEVLCLHLFEVKCISFPFFFIVFLFWRPVNEFLRRTPSSVSDPHRVVLLQAFAPRLQLASVAFTIACVFIQRRKLQ